MSKENPVVPIKGVAVGDGGVGARVVKVELSFDEGKTWTEAKITNREEKDPTHPVFSWAHWEYVHKLNLKHNRSGKIVAMVRSIDSAGNI